MRLSKILPPVIGLLGMATLVSPVPAPALQQKDRLALFPVAFYGRGANSLEPGDSLVATMTDSILRADLAQSGRFDLIDRSQIILLLISPSFLASDYLYEQEMQHAMERHQSGAARVVPIIIRSANISNTPFKDLLALPRNLQPVDTWHNRDAIWAKIAQEIRDVCNNLRNS